MKRKNRQKLDLVLMVFVFAVFISSHYLMSDMFFGAYNQPNQQMLFNIQVNTIGEANIEFVLIVLSWVAITYLIVNDVCIAVTGNGVLDNPTSLEC